MKSLLWSIPLAVATWLLLGCKTIDPPPWPEVVPGTNGTPRLEQFEPGAWRSGQPDASGFAWMATNHFRTIIKLNGSLEGSADASGSDQAARDVGINVVYYPIDTISQLWPPGPDPTLLSNVVWQIGHAPRPLLVHCEHGEDRTGLAVGLYRLTEGTNKAAAYEEMRNHGFHRALQGLEYRWEQAK